MNIGNKIRERRIALGITQEELAIKMGYKSRSSINKIENDTNDIPQSKVVEFANALDTTPAYLMGWTETPEDKDSELQEYLEELKNRDEMKMLFSLAKGATKEDVMKAVKIIEALQKDDLFE